MLTQERPGHTKYERARIIGARALQISQGAPLLLKFSEKELRALKCNPVQIAKKEYEEGVIPMEIIRNPPKEN